MDLDEKICLITGGTSGIGAAISRQVLEQGAHLVTVGRAAAGRESAITNLSKIAEEHHRRTLFIPADIADADQCRRVADEAEAEFGRVDVLVHAAGGAVPGNLLELGVEEWMKAFDVHVHAIFHLAQALVPKMKKERGGVILLISSAAGLRGCLGSLAYSVVKGSLPQFARALARELADFNIRVNCISPGVIRTPFQDFLTPAQVKNNLENRIPLHREGTPEDVAAVAVTLIKNDFITGENVVVDGGMTMRIV